MRPTAANHKYLSAFNSVTRLAHKWQAGKGWVRSVHHVNWGMSQTGKNRRAENKNKATTCETETGYTGDEWFVSKFKVTTSLFSPVCINTSDMPWQCGGHFSKHSRTRPPVHSLLIPKCLHQTHYCAHSYLILWSLPIKKKSKFVIRKFNPMIREKTKSLFLKATTKWRENYTSTTRRF